MSCSLRRLTELVQGTTTLSNQPIWLLGTWYGVKNQDTSDATLPPEAMQAFLQDFQSRIWCTYRRDFASIGDTGITSDVGWGCTLRSGQMLVAEALSRVVVGRHWQRTPDTADDITSVVSLLVDEAAATSPLSLQHICEAGREAGLVAGRWVGPWMLCKGLEVIFKQQPVLGLRLHVICDPGGGAPALDVQRIQALLRPTSSVLTSMPEADGLADDASDGSGDAEAADPLQAPSNPAAADNGEHATEPNGAASTSGRGPLLLLVPLTLGIDKVNPMYLPQLQQMLTYPQTVGIVGGRPGASLYFIGSQGSNFIFLDPHESQLAATLPTHLHTYFCETVRLLPQASLDPSLAIGFLCQTLGDFEDLCVRLRRLATQHSSAPVMMVADTKLGETASCELPDASTGHQGSDVASGQHDDWEIL